MRKMPTKRSTVPNAQKPDARTSSPWLGYLAAIAFFLLAVALAVRPILGEFWTVRANDLLSPSPLWWNNSPAAMYIAHIHAAGGLLCGALWMLLVRKTWRFTGLELPAAILVIAALLAISGASDRRLAINVAVGTILPLLMAAMLSQMLFTNGRYRRALLAALIGAAVANGYTSWRQQTTEYEDTYAQYMADKDSFWRAQGKNPTDPEVAIFESRLLARQPTGYFYHPNVMASFLLLSLSCTMSAVAGFGWWHGRRRVADPPGAVAGPDRLPGTVQTNVDPKSDLGRLLAPAAAVVLALLAMSQFIVIGWVGSAGAMAGIGIALIVGAAVWWLRNRPAYAAALCLIVLGGLQVVIVALSLNATSLYPRLAASDGKIKSVAVRLNYWRGASVLFARDPLTGVGPGQFGKRYLAIKPIFASEEVAHPHNWLLNMAAEWGLLGLLATILALAWPGWKIITSLAGRTDDGPDAVEPASGLLPALGVAFGCCLVAMLGIVPAGSWVLLYMSPPLAWMLVVAAVAALSPLVGRMGQAILLAGLIAFFVHSTVEMGSGVAAAAWPFWACMAMALTWSPPSAASTLPGSLPALKQRSVAILLSMAVAAVAVLGLTYRPLQAVLWMNAARADLSASHPYQAAEKLHAAAELDPLDPAPCSALAMLYQRAAQVDVHRRQSHLTQAVEAAEMAVQRDPQDNILRNDLAYAWAHLASVTKKQTDAEGAVRAMQSAVDLYPNWPRGHWKLATLLAAAAELPPVRPDMVRQAIAEMDTAVHLDQGWPCEDARRFTPAELDQMRTGRETLLHKIKSWAKTTTTDPVSP